MIVVTGGAGFIGRNLVEKLIDLGHKDIVIVDNHAPRFVRRSRFKEDRFNIPYRGANITYLRVEDSWLWLGFNAYNIDVIYHLGARTDTMEKDEQVFYKLNYQYSIFIWELCTEYQIPMIYASSAATYGDGEDGFSDEEFSVDLKPLNPYGVMKHAFDYYSNSATWAKHCPPFWIGLKFFNVYGNHEDHKGAMASVIWHLYRQIKETGEVKLFRSHVNWCEDGFQERDFIHVSDVVNTMIWLNSSKENVPSDIYNLGTGIARTYNDLAKAIFKSLGKPENISYIDTPLEIRDSYQYYTCAKMDKLNGVIPRFGGEYTKYFKSLEEGIDLYIKQLEYENR